MAKTVIEWPQNDVYQRKYVESWVVFEEEGGLAQYYVNGAEAGDHFLLGGISQIVKKRPVYYPIERGYYLSQKDEALFLERKFNSHKSYKIGVSGENWLLYKVNTGTGTTTPLHITKDVFFDLLHPPEKKKFLVRELGILNRKYLLSHSNIYFEGSPIGVREGRTIILDNHYFAKDLQSILGPSWEIS